MNNIFFFDSTLSLEIYVIGYKHVGESIVLLVKTDSKTVYSGLVDCYKKDNINVACDVLKNHHLENFNFVCLTHPHEDHCLGITDILENCCTSETHFWLPPYRLLVTNGTVNREIENFSLELVDLLKSRGHLKPKIREVSDNKLMESIKFINTKDGNKYEFRISSFAPCSETVLRKEINHKSGDWNSISIGITINCGRFNIILAGDIENQAFGDIEYLGIENNLDYLKIPHHGSSSANEMLDLLGRFCISGPDTSVVTAYKKFGLPEKKVLNCYWRRIKGINIFCTEKIMSEDANNLTYGIVKTTFDITESTDFPIDTTLFGNAIKFDADNFR